jgi:hypothetical protein
MPCGDSGCPMRHTPRPMERVLSSLRVAPSIAALILRTLSLRLGCEEHHD